jgi:hypothetical protein
MPRLGGAQDHNGAERQRQLLPPRGRPGDVLSPDGRALQELEQAINDSADEGTADEGSEWPGQLIGDLRRADVALVVARLGGEGCELWLCPHVPIASQPACRPAGPWVGSSPTKGATSVAATQLSSSPARVGRGPQGQRPTVVPASDDGCCHLCCHQVVLPRGSTCALPGRKVLAVSVADRWRPRIPAGSGTDVALFRWSPSDAGWPSRPGRPTTARPQLTPGISGRLREAIEDGPSHPWRVMVGRWDRARLLGGGVGTR